MKTYYTFKKAVALILVTIAMILGAHTSSVITEGEYIGHYVFYGIFLMTDISMLLYIPVAYLMEATVKKLFK